MRTRTWHVVAVLVAGFMTTSLAACEEVEEERGKDGFTVGLLLPSRTVPAGSGPTNR